MPADLDDVDRRLTKLEAKVDSMVTSLNRVNADNHDHIVSLERKFAKLEKGTAKIAKVADPRKSEKNPMELVDKALAAFDKKRT